MLVSLGQMTDPELIRVLLVDDQELFRRGVKMVLEAEGTFVAMNNAVSQSVPHLHVHVVPRKKGDGLKGFFWPRRRYDDDAHARGVAERIRAALADRRGA